MSRWEYRAIQVEHRAVDHNNQARGERYDRIGAVEAVLNELGREGWEAVGLYASSNWRIILKRPIGD